MTFVSDMGLGAVLNEMHTMEAEDVAAAFLMNAGAGIGTRITDGISFGLRIEFNYFGPFSENTFTPPGYDFKVNELFVIEALGEVTFRLF